MNAISVALAECSPTELLNVSTLKPNKKEEISNNHPGTSKGKSKIKKI
jgi:hypothetical protein